MKKKNIVLLLAVVAAAGAAYWYFGAADKSAPAAQETGARPGGGGGGGAGGPTLVNVIKPERRDVPVVLAATGSVVPISSVDLHPQTTSTIRKVHIKEGQNVRAGELMFSLDDRADRANVGKAQAQIARDRAALADLERQYKRSQELYEQKFIAQSALDTLRSQVEAARAVQVAGNAALQAEQVAASYTAIRAPMSGRVGAINVYPGSLVQPATSLTSVTQLDPINVAFTVPESSLGDLLAAQRAGKVAVQASTGADAKPVSGTLSFIDNTVDPQAGAIRAKAQFDNRNTMLWPGQYATTSITVRTLKDAVVVPQSAIVINARGTFVYVVDAQQSAQFVPVKRLYAFGTDAAVSGLSGDEKVITEGKQNLRPGGKVRVAGAGKAEGKGARAAQAVAQK
ncbi:MAG: efflux RND transporter periplasmic adaptor subunit [Pseudomonadota bacterium]